MKKIIAIYGKGGIGKSTVSSNISATLGHHLNKKVLQIGCDPKHDSTLMLSDRTDETVLNTILEKDDLVSIDDIVFRGKYNTSCVELGGPEPGVGCAGRGIIKGLELLNKFQIIDNDEYEVILYDILGDVVCGGFFEPLRKGNTQEMYIITSGEFNSIFAANNLCKGYLNNRVLHKKVKLAGIIGNCRGIKNEEQIIGRFSNAVNVPLVSLIPRDERIEYCTFIKKPVIEEFPDSSITNVFIRIANKIIESESCFNIPAPLKLNELRELYSDIYMIK